MKTGRAIETCRGVPGDSFLAPLVYLDADDALCANSQGGRSLLYRKMALKEKGKI